jgi:hypothetical protein
MKAPRPRQLADLLAAMKPTTNGSKKFPINSQAAEV